MAIYTVAFSGVTHVTNPIDAFEITAGSTTKVRIRDVRINQNSEFADAQAELMLITVIRGYTTTGSGGTTATPVNVQGHSGALAATSVVKYGNTTAAANGSPVTLVADAWNVAAGWCLRDILRPRLGKWDTEGEELILDKSQRLVVRIAAPADTMTITGTLIFEEVGQNPI